MPFQCQIHYTKLDGAKYVRVISQSKPVTRERRRAEATARTSVLASHAAQQSAHMARRGSYQKSRMNMIGYGRILARCAASTGRAEDSETVAAYAAQMADLDGLLGAEMEEEGRHGMAGGMAEALGAGGMEDADARMRRAKTRGVRRKKNDKLSNAIFKAKRLTAGSMASPAYAVRSATAAPRAAAAAPRRVPRAPANASAGPPRRVQTRVAAAAVAAPGPVPEARTTALRSTLEARRRS